MNGLTQVTAFAGTTWAVAMAPTSAVVMPMIGPMNIEMGFPRAVLLSTRTLTLSIAGNVTSAGMTDAFACMTPFCVAVPALIAFCTAGPVAERSSKLSNTSATAPANAPESAAVCDCVRATINMPTSMASIAALMNARNPTPTMTSVMPRSSRRLR